MSSVEYFIHLKKNIENQICFFQDQKRFLQEMTSFSFDNEKQKKITEQIIRENGMSDFLLDITDEYSKNESLSFIKNKIEELYQLQRKVNDQIYQLCDHSFVKDYIDTFPERSEVIYYCTKCYHTLQKTSKEKTNNVYRPALP